MSKYSSNAFNEELKRYTAKVELVFAGDETFLAGKYKRNVEISVVAILVDDAWEKIYSITESVVDSEREAIDKKNSIITKVEQITY